MLHGRGLYPLQEVAPSVWGLPDPVTRPATPAASTVTSQPQQQSSSILRPQLLWPPHGLPGYPTLPPQPLYIPVLPALPQGVRPADLAGYAAYYSSNQAYWTPPAFSHPSVVQLPPLSLAPLRPKPEDVISLLPDFTKKPPALGSHTEITPKTKAPLGPSSSDLGNMIDDALLKEVCKLVDQDTEEMKCSGDSKGLVSPSKPAPIKEPSTETVGHSTEPPKSVDLKSILRRLSAESLPAMQEGLVTRPVRIANKQGSTGSSVSLRANFFPIVDVAGMQMFKYHVKVIPAVPHNSPDYKFILAGCNEALGNFVLHDEYLFCSKQLTGNACKLFSEYGGKSFYINLTEEGDLSVTERQIVLQELVKNLMRSLHMFKAGAAFFTKDFNVALCPDKLGGWTLKSGFLPQVVRCDSGFQLNVNVVNMVIRPETAYEAYEHIQEKSKHLQQTYKSMIIGKYVMTSYNNRIYCIKDVKFSFSPLTVFTFKDGVQSFKDFYKKKYGVTIKKNKQPLLMANVASGGRLVEVYLVPELCRLAGLSSENRKDFFLTRAIYEEVTKSPRLFSLEILRFVKELAHTKNEKTMAIIREWGLDFSCEMVKLTGRHLPAEVAKVGPNPKVPHPPKTLFDWTEEWRSCLMLSCVPVRQWAILVPTNFAKSTEGFIKRVLQPTSANLGIALSPPFIIELENEEFASFAKELKTLFAREKPQIVFCILATPREDRYRSIKKLCTVDYGVASQVVVKKSMETNKYDHPIAKRLAVQMNCKVGGTPWSVEVPLRLCMVVGVDVCVDSRNRAVSFCSVVASYNKDFSRYFSTSFEFRTKDLEQLSNSLCEHIAKAIHRFKTFQGHCPANIVIYRDGVGNRILPHVATREVQLLQKWLNEIYKTDSWRLSFVIVSKHSNAKIMGVGNPPAEVATGTVVDSCITRPERYDFLLLSGQTKRDKVPAFTHYNVIFDNTTLKPDQLQRLTYKMTHLYFNIKGTVRVPAPLRYATRLVGQVGNVLHQVPHKELSNVLHFL